MSRKQKPNDESNSESARELAAPPVTMPESIAAKPLKYYAPRAVHDPRLVELKSAYADAASLIELWRVMRMDANYTAKRNRLLAAIDAFVRVEA